MRRLLTTKSSEDRKGFALVLCWWHILVGTTTLFVGSKGRRINLDYSWSIFYCVAAYISIPSNSTRVLFYAHFSLESIIVGTTMSSVRRSTRARKEVVDPYQNELNLLACKKVAAKR
jgi:hypothetical protein